MHLLDNNFEKIQLSIVMPAYNEDKIIDLTIYKVEKICRSLGVNYELIIVDDGSIDNTRLVANEIAENNKRIKIIGYEENVGKGYALKYGFFEAKGENVIFLDSDLDINPEQIEDYWEALKKGDIVIASKRHPQSQIKAPRIRLLLSYIFHLMVKFSLDIPISDTQSGLKAIKRKPFIGIFKILRSKGYVFDVELLLISHLKEMNIIEMPIIINQKSLFDIKEALGMFMELIMMAYKFRIQRHYDELLINLPQNYDVNFNGYK